MYMLHIICMKDLYLVGFNEYIAYYVISTFNSIVWTTLTKHSHLLLLMTSYQVLVINYATDTLGNPTSLRRVTK